MSGNHLTLAKRFGVNDMSGSLAQGSRSPNLLDIFYSE